MASGFQKRLDYREKSSDRQDQKEHPMIKGQKLQIYSADQFLAPLYLQKVDNITCREKVQLLPIITQHICLFQKNCGWIARINHDFPEVSANLLLPKLSRDVFCSGQITVGAVPMLLKHFGIQTHWHELRNLLLTSLVLESASTSPPLMRGDRGQILSPPTRALGSH